MCLRWVVAPNTPPPPSTPQGALLQSPLVTSWGEIVIVSDQMAISLYPDPANPTFGQASGWYPRGTFGPSLYASLPPGAIVEDMVYGGAILDDNDVLYLVDQRNRALRAVQLYDSDVSPFVELPNSPYWFNRSIPFGLPETASLMLVPQVQPAATQLWVPTTGSMLGCRGPAIIVATSFFSVDAVPAPFFAPYPGTGVCVWPEDYGSVQLAPNAATSNKAAVLLLGSNECGAVAYTADATSGSVVVEWTTEVLKYSFSTEGEHAHPVLDADTGSLLWVDYGARYGIPQQLCCVMPDTGFGTCGNGEWFGECFNLPAEEYNPDTLIFLAWDWMALSVSGGNVYITASGYPSVTSTVMHSALMVYALATGKRIGLYRGEDDMFNSAALVVKDSNGMERAFITTTRGKVHCFGSGAAVSAGPLWTTSAEVGAIPDDDVPQSTYSFLTLTPRGTLLITASAGGKDWSDEKTVYAIVNGVLTPPTGTDKASQWTSTIIAVSLITTLLVGAAGGVAGYYRVPSFRSAVDDGIAKARAMLPAGMGKSAYSTVSPSVSVSMLGSPATTGTGGFNSGGGYGGV